MLHAATEADFNPENGNAKSVRCSNRMCGDKEDRDSEGDGDGDGDPAAGLRPHLQFPQATIITFPSFPTNLGELLLTISQHIYLP